MKDKKITLIAAMDQNNLIGNKNALPWHLPADLKFFKQQTTGKTILMGRKTCESLPFVLPKRRNLVLSRNQSFNRKGFEIVNNLEQLDQVQDLMVIGGAKIYELMLPMATHLIFTKIHAEFDGDTHFPTVDWAAWQINRITNIPISADNPNYAFDFIFYEKIN
jgi:dihydrofolate reductase